MDSVRKHTMYVLIFPAHTEFDFRKMLAILQSIDLFCTLG